MKQASRPLTLSGAEPHIHNIAIVDAPPAGDESALIAALARILIRTCTTATPATLAPVNKQPYAEAA